MADKSSDFRDPKVHRDASTGPGIGKILLYALLALLALLALAWLLGFFDNDVDTATVPAATTTTEEAVVVTTD
ncbi:hypothetical protein [Jannaschia sp. LMIT008]|uniref:hypothetical protein n=1 Tax=Jannaschia maritima TaxID=3032585 RepID=UPI00281285FF|nr:hypothetical protein [Jannaschia sp. LMIT008]